MAELKRLLRDDAATKSADIVASNIEALQSLFPEAFTQGRIDFQVLRALLGDAVDERDERYGLHWHGKHRARQLALTPSTGTLLPVPGASLDWDGTHNLLIEGDNLEVLKLLQKSLCRKIKAIYIDPPYNTGRNLLYPNDYRDGIRAYLEVTGQVQGGARLTSNPESGGRFHAAWLSMMYPRLKLARTLLAADGVLICTIDDNEVSQLGVLLKEIFEEGSYEHVCVPIIHNPRGLQGRNFSYVHEYAWFVYPTGIKAICDRSIRQEEVQWSPFRNWGSESGRSDARNCFYPVLVKDGRIIGFGEVCPEDVHPRQTEVIHGVAHVYPIDSTGVERKWRYARQSVEQVSSMLRAVETAHGYEIGLGKTFALYRTVWSDPRYDANDHGTGLVRELVPGSPFTFPKSLWAVHDCLCAATGDDPDAIVLDFFAGSGTTAHAVMELNRQTGGRRRFILVQLPEPVAGHPGFPTIFEVTRARVQAAASRIRAEDPAYEGDLGFRVYRLASSCIRAWNPEASSLEGSLAASVESLMPGRTDEDVLCELLLKRGLDLCTPIESREIAGKAVHSLGRGSLMVCLADALDTGTVESLAAGIAAWWKQLAPQGQTRVVLKDAGFVDDLAKATLSTLLAQHGLSDVRSL